MGLESQMEEKVMECICKAEDVFRGKSIPMIPINFNMTGKTGGQYRCKRKRNWVTNQYEYLSHELRFNRILMHENSDEYLNNVVPHEVSHYIVSLMYPTAQSHGREWKDMMAMVMGVTPTTTHNMDTSNSRRRVRRFTYRCDCRQHDVSAQMHKKISGFSSRVCKYCRGSLRYTGKSFYK